MATCTVAVCKGLMHIFMEQLRTFTHMRLMATQAIRALGRDITMYFDHISPFQLGVASIAHLLTIGREQPFSL